VTARTLARAGGILLACSATAAWSQTYTVNSINPITAFGEVAAAATGDTIFFQNNTTVTAVSGSGARIKGTVRRATVTIRCAGSGSPNTCSIAGNNARVRVGSLSSTGRARAFSEFIATPGTGVLTGTLTGSTLDFVVSGFTGTGNKTFFLDTKLPIKGDNEGVPGDTGAETSTYYVYVAKDPTTPTTGLTAAATITIRRSLYIQLPLIPLRFGSLVRQPSGTSAQVTINQTTGARTQTGNVNLIAAPLPAFGRAEITVKGEPSTTFAVSYSPTGNIVMSSGANTLSITTLKTNGSSGTLDGTGTLTLGVGGRITVTASTPRGEYSGNLTVTVTYN
jgi:hypothetical protein